MVERFLSQTSFSSQEDFNKNLKINVPENFNFGYDVVDAWAAEQPDKKALLWTNDKGESRQFSFAEMKRYTDMTASYFQSLGIGRGDMVMLILKRRYEFWYSTIALHKLGATVIPATHLLTKKDIIYRCNAADIKMIVAAGEGIILQHIKRCSHRVSHCRKVGQCRTGNTGRFRRFPSGHRECRSIRASPPCEHQRRHLSDVFYFRYYR